MSTPINKSILVSLVAWNQLAKSMSMWKAAKNNERGWFLLLAFTNTLGVLDLLYLNKDKNQRQHYLNKLYP